MTAAQADARGTGVGHPVIASAVAFVWLLACPQVPAIAVDALRGIAEDKLMGLLMIVVRLLALARVHGPRAHAAVAGGHSSILRPEGIRGMARLQFRPPGMSPGE